MPRKHKTETTKRINLLVPESLHTALTKHAAKHDARLSDIIREALAVYVGRETPKVNPPGRPWPKSKE